MNKVAAVPLYVRWALRRRIARTWKSEKLGHYAADVLFILAETAMAFSLVFIFMDRGGAFERFYRDHPYAFSSFAVVALMGFDHWYFGDRTRLQQYLPAFRSLSPARQRAADIGAEVVVLLCLFSPLLLKPLFA
jgi:hypothetical protein